MNGAFGLGFRVKSGYAIAVALGGSASAPGSHRPPDRRAERSSRRPPRASRTTTVSSSSRTTRGELARLVKLITRCAIRSVTALFEDERFAGMRCRGAGLVVGSVIDPAAASAISISAPTPAKDSCSAPFSWMRCNRAR